MLKFNNKTAFLSFLAFFSLVIQGCSEKDLYEPPTPEEPSEYFSYSTKSDFTFDINYHQDYYGIVFELYEEDPIIVDAEGNITKTSAEPVYRASTDAKGRYSDVVELPSALSEVYLYSDYMGTVGSVKLTVTDNKVTYDQNEYIKQLNSASRATRAENTWTVPAGYRTLGNWNSDGLPDYLLEDAQLDNQFLLDISNAYPNRWDNADKKTIWDKHPEYFYKDGQPINTDVHIKKDTKAEMVFLMAVATKSNTVGYYFYKTENPPQSVEDIDKFYVAFPLVSSYTVGGKMKCPLMLGNQIQIQYEDEDGVMQDVIPAGWSIGFFLVDGGYNSGNLVKGQNLFFGNPEFNKDKIPHAVALFDNDGEHIAIGFEDVLSIKNNGEPNGSCDYDFNDAVFSIRVDAGSVDPDPELPPGGDPDDNKTVYKGTLAFEDMWPRKYDYDLNDVVVRYECTVYKEYLTNRVYKVEDVFTPVHSGGTLAVGFGYQYPATSHLIQDVVIDNPNGPSTFMKGEKIEPGQEQPTIILFDNIRSVALNEPIKVTTTFTGDAKVTPPYNPFIIIDSNLGRSRELHLSGKLPTSLFDTKLFGTENDKSDPDNNLYYVSEKGYVFAVDVASLEFKWCPESVSIETAYPQYGPWAESLGTKQKDWYKKPSTTIPWN